MVSALINPLIYSYLLSQISLLAPSKRLPKYSNAHYLDILLFILKTGCSFRDSCINLSLPPNHFSSVFKKFSYWSSKGVFKLIYLKLKKVYSELQFPNLNSLDLFIDSSNIRNKNGQDLLSYNFKDKGKKGNKLSLIIDDYRFPLEATIDSSQPHDCSIMEGLIDKLDSRKYLPDKIYLIGDKGYIKKKKIRYGEKIIKIVAPHRKNQKKTNTKKEKSRLKKRYKVENSFSRLKQFRRTSFRYDKEVSKYFSFVLMALIIISKEVIMKIERENELKKV